ncbi:MAG TPA: hypothetical protein VJ377_04040 [Dehalococcoidales bacterium]|nr:hypothetical protein [Dehalococcoidales bacterium]
MDETTMGFPGHCQTTAMGIMPHKDVERALQLALGLDIPFWPQLPNVSYYEDMYAQASEHFPGMTVDVENKKITFDTARFEAELAEYSQKMADPAIFNLSKSHSAVYHRFLAQDLGEYTAIRGQLIGPVSFGFKVPDENNRPIIYNESVRALLFDFIKSKVNAQVRELREKNPKAFVWLDEPGLGWVFSGLSGYDDLLARREYREFLNSLEVAGALHLCANVNLPYLLGLGTGLLSFDAYQLELLPRGYADSVAEFIKGGGLISWGIVPTDSSTLENESPEGLAGRLETYWEVVAANSDVTAAQVAAHALLAPARCCLKNIGAVGASGESGGNGATCDLKPEEKIVETAFDYLKEVSRILRKKFGL